MSIFLGLTLPDHQSLFYCCASDHAHYLGLLICSPISGLIMVYFESNLSDCILYFILDFLSDINRDINKFRHSPQELERNNLDQTSFEKGKPN